MSIIYDGSHSVTFIQGSVSSGYTVKRSWIDFHLIPEKAPSVTPRVPKTVVLDVPFASSSLDYTLSIGKGLFFEPSNGEWTFYVDHDKWDSWYEAKTTIENFINGKALWCVIEDDHDYKYSGRFLVTGWEDGSDYSKITISYDIDGYAENDGTRITNDFVYDI